jgi:hypothetical protein
MVRLPRANWIALFIATTDSYDVRGNGAMPPSTWHDPHLEYTIEATAPDHVGWEAVTMTACTAMKTMRMAIFILVPPERPPTIPVRE